MLFFDTETTGLIKNAALHLVHQPHIIEIGLIRDPVPPGQQREFHTLLRPPVKLPEIITKITGLTDNALADAPTFEDVYEDLKAFVKGEDTMVAHNMPFDHGMLMFELRRLKVDLSFPMPGNLIDTVQLAKRFYAGRFMKLQALYEDLIGPYEQKHRAIDDCEILLKVYHALMVKGN